VPVNDDHVDNINTSGKCIGPFLGENKCTSRYGMRNGVHHNGIDIVPANIEAEGTAIYSICDGTVVDGNHVSETGGNCIVIQCTSPFNNSVKSLKSYVGMYFTYMHLSAFNSNVKTGDSVKVGDCIGYCGNTGASDGAHCHLQISSGSPWGDSGAAFIDPAYYLIDKYDGSDYEGLVWTNEVIEGGYGRGKKSARGKSNNHGIASANNKIMGRSKSTISTKSGKGRSNGRIINKNSSQSISGRGSNTYTVNGYDEYGNAQINNFTFDQSQMLSILSTIAENSNKTDPIIQLLASIVSNTNDDDTSTPTSKIVQLLNSMNTGNHGAPITGLSQALSNNGSVAQGVYTIARQ
jgi:hypothetical protein